MQPALDKIKAEYKAYREHRNFSRMSWEHKCNLTEVELRASEAAKIGETRVSVRLLNGIPEALIYRGFRVVLQEGDNFEENPVYDISGWAT